jgi:hypothetical protein
MNHIDIEQIAVLVIVVLVILGAYGLSRLGTRSDALLHTLRELERQTVVLLIFGVGKLSRLGVLGDELSHLAHELKRRTPVYSAETVLGREAEFIRDSLPKRFPTVLVVIALVLFGAVAWWLSR